MKITQRAEQDIDQQKEFNRKKLAKKIKQLLKHERETSNINYIQDQDIGIEFQRLKIKTDSLDHRAYFDYKNSETIVFAVRHRDYAYSEEDMKEARRRLEDLGI